MDCTIFRGSSAILKMEKSSLWAYCRDEDWVNQLYVSQTRSSRLLGSPSAMVAEVAAAANGRQGELKRGVEHEPSATGIHSLFTSTTTFALSVLIPTNFSKFSLYSLRTHFMPSTMPCALHVSSTQRTRNVVTVAVFALLW